MQLTEQEMKQRRSFIDFFDAHVTMGQFKAMMDELDWKQYSWTQMENGTRDVTESQLNIIARYMGKHPAEVIERFGLGLYRIPAAIVRRIKNEPVQAA